MERPRLTGCVIKGNYNKVVPPRRQSCHLVARTKVHGTRRRPALKKDEWKSWVSSRGKRIEILIVHPTPAALNASATLPALTQPSLRPFANLCPPLSASLFFHLLLSERELNAFTHVAIMSRRCPFFVLKLVCLFFNN